MVRNFKPKKVPDPSADMDGAISAIADAKASGAELSVRKAAKLFAVPRQSLANRLRASGQPKPRNGPPTLMPPEYEERVLLPHSGSGMQPMLPRPKLKSRLYSTAQLPV